MVNCPRCCARWCAEQSRRACPRRGRLPPNEARCDEFDERSVTTSWNNAPTTVTPHDLATNGRWNVLMSAEPPRGWTLGVDVTQVLRVARRHLDDLRCHLHLFAAPLLPSASTRFADCQRHLVVGSPFVGWAAQCISRQQQYRRIVVDRFARIATKLRHRLSEGRERFGRDLHSRT